MLNKYPKKYMSYSQISAYMRCPYCFKLQYVDEVERKDTKYLFFGRLIHELYENYSDRADMADVFKYKFIEGSSIFDDKEDSVKFFRKGVDAINNYANSEFSNKVAIKKEMMFNFKIVPGLPNIIGYIDVIFGDPDDPSSWEVVDYKTSSSAKPKKELSYDLQMPIYALAIYNKTGHFPASVTYYYPVVDKKQTAVHLGDGVYEYLNQRKPVVKVDVRDAIVKINEVYQDIMAEKFDERAMHFFCQPECREVNGWGAVPDESVW